MTQGKSLKSDFQTKYISLLQCNLGFLL